MFKAKTGLIGVGGSVGVHHLFTQTLNQKLIAEYILVDYNINVA